MAREERTITVCDCHLARHPKPKDWRVGSKYHFSRGHAHYEIDLCAECSPEFLQTDDKGRYVKYARRVRSGLRSRLRRFGPILGPSSVPRVARGLV